MFLCSSAYLILAANLFCSSSISKLLVVYCENWVMISLILLIYDSNFVELDKFELISTSIFPFSFKFKVTFASSSNLNASCNFLAMYLYS